VDVGGKAQAVTDAFGFFQTPQFPVGTYTMSFTKDGYWTLNASVSFNQAGSFRFNDTIRLSKITSGTGATVDPSFIMDLDMDNNPHITVNAANKIKSLIAIPYDCGTYQDANQTHINITTDIGTSFSSAITSGKTVNPLGSQTNIEERLREFDRRINQEMLSKGIQPGVSRHPVRAVTEEEEQLTFYKFQTFTEYPTVTTVTANLIHTGTDHCLIYLDNSQNISDSYIQQLGQAFDDFYDRMIQYFGDVKVDIDGNDKVYILLTELPHDDSGTILGYFTSLNEYHKSEQFYSNEKEMLYMTTYNYNNNPTEWLKAIKSTSAHEFQHLINFSWRGVKTPTWVNEGLSMMAEEIAIAEPGRHNPFLDQRVAMYLKYHVYDCLQDWQGDLLDYASSYMFMRYYADRFGEEKLKDINTLNYGYGGTDTLTRIADTDFNEIFKDWLTAVILDAVCYTTSDPRYFYKTLDLSAFDFPKETAGYIDMAHGAGAFIYMANLEAAKRIDIELNGDYQIGMRLVMLPVPGESFSASGLPSFSKIH
jgi:hypothetical protein